MFKIILKTAYLNLWRRKSRTFILIVMISFGLAAMIFTQGLYEGMMSQMIDDALRTSSGDFMISKEGHYKSQLLSDYIYDTEPVISALKKNNNVAHFVTRVKNEGMVSSAKYSQGAKILGVNLEQEQYFINYKKPLRQGRLELNENKKEAIIGQDLADKLKVKIGRKIVLTGQALDKELVAGAFRVVGIIRTNNPEIDEMSVLIRQKHMQELFKMKGYISEVSVLVKDKKQAKQTESTIKAYLTKNSSQKFEVLGWEELYALLAMMKSMFVYFVYISYFIVFLAVAVGFFNILLISILERVKEYGILLAVGTSFSIVKKMIYLEALIVGMFGFIFGSFFGALLLIYSKFWGIDLSNFATGLNKMGMASIMYAEIHFGYFVLAFVVVLLTSYLSAIIPVWKLKKLKPVQAIRFV